MKWSLEILTTPISIGVPGIILNILILAVYFRDWCKGKRPTPRDLILSTMTFTNLSFQCILIYNGLIYYLQTRIMIPMEIYLFQDVILFSLVDSSFWQTALLSTYYCVKLFNFSHSLFQWVKKKISTSTNLLLLGSSLFCSLISFPLIWTVNLDSPENGTESAMGIKYIVGYNIFLYLFNVLFGCCLPFTLTFTCITLSVQLVLKQVWSIRRNALQLSSPPQIGGLLRAAGTMLFCAFMDLVCCGALVGPVLFKFKGGEVAHLISGTIVTLYPTVRSSVLIIGNPQLKKQLGEMCFCS